MKKWFLIALTLLCTAPPSQAVDPSLNWKTLHTAHFYIHFTHNQEPIARRLANIAEQVHDDLSDWISWQPGEPTHIVLSDESDVANGLASPIPYNRSVLFLTPPNGIDSLEDYHDWLTLLFTHEYTHILHLDKGTGLAAAGRNIFGRYFLFFPNLIQPRWFIEGLAVQHETSREIGVGRGQSSYFHMLMRSEIAQGIKPVAQVNQLVRSWPAGAVPYLYGTHFLQFIEEKYGEQAVKKWIDGYSDNLIPARLNSTARSAVGQSLPQLWYAFSAWLEQTYAKQNTITHASPLTEGERLTHHGFRTGSINQDSEGNLYYVREDQLRHTALMRRNHVGDTRELADLNNGALIDVHKQRGVLIAQPEVCNNVSIYYDLFQYREDQGLQRLTHCARYVFARWHPEGEKIAAAQVTNGNSALHLLNAQGVSEATLWQAEHGETLGSFDWSPDGERLVAAIWRPQLGWNIEEFVVASRQWIAITDSPLIESSPRYSADGKHLYFSAEYGGVYNIWQYSPAQQQFSQMSNVPTGAFQPLIGHDGALYYIGNHAQGFDIYQLDQMVAISTRDAAPVTPLMPAPNTTLLQTGEVKDYAPLSSLRPRAWFPHLVLSDGANEIGATVDGSDAINRHNYVATLAYDIDNNYPVGGFSYRYTPFNWASLQIAAIRFNDVTLDNNDRAVRIRREDQLHLNVRFPFSGLARSWHILTGLSSSHESDQETAIGITRRADTRDNIAGVGLLYSDTDEQLRAISPADGREIRLTAENSGVLNSDFSGNVYLLDWREFVRLGTSDHVLGLRYVRGHGTDNPRPFELGGIGSGSIIGLLNGNNGGAALLNQRLYEFRGYDSSVFGLIGRRMQLLSAEWRFPISLIERGWMAPPVGLNRLSARVFIENAAAWQGSSPQRTFSSAGFELHLDVNALYFDDFRLRLGYAHGFDDVLGEDQLYLAIGGGF